MMTRLLAPLGRHARPILAGGIFAGLLLPDLASLMRPMFELSVLLLLTASLVKIDWVSVGGYLRRPGLAGSAALWQMLVAPVLVAGLLQFVELPPGLEMAMVLMAAAPPVTASPAIAEFIGLDGPLVLVLMVWTTLLLPLTVTPLALWLLDLELAMGAGPFFLRIAAFVAIPFVAAAAIRRAMPAGWPERRRESIDGFIVVMLVVFAVAVMDGVTARLLAEPLYVAGFVVAATALNLALQAAGAGMFLWLGRRGALSIGLVGGYRNIGVMLVATAGVAGPDMWLFVAVAQIPMYILPALTNRLYRRVLSAGT